MVISFSQRLPGTKTARGVDREQCGRDMREPTVRRRSGGILRAELLHDVRTMKLDGARDDAGCPPSLLIGDSSRDLSQRHALARGQQRGRWN